MKLKYFFVLLITFVIGIGFYWFSIISHPSDRSMETFFSKNETDFEKLRIMFEEDKNCSTISEYGNTPIIDYSKKEPRANCNISEQRQSEYLNLFKKLDIQALINRDYYHQELLFFTTSYRSGKENENGETVNTRKGYVFIINPKFETVDSLDNIGINDTNFGEKKYRKLKGNWYLFYEKGIPKPE